MYKNIFVCFIGIKLKDLKINLVRIKKLPSNDTDFRVPCTERINVYNESDSNSLTETPIQMEEKCENSKLPLIQSNKLPERASEFCENHKKVLEILNTFKNSKIMIENSKRKAVVLKVTHRYNSVNTTDIVPLINCYTNVIKFDKLNPVQEEIKEVDYIKEEEWANKCDSVGTDHVETDVNCRPVLETTDTLPIVSDSLASDEYQHDVSLSCKQTNECLEKKENSYDSSKIVKKTDIHSELRKEFNSETEDSLLGEFASNDSNASLTCEQVSSNSLILKINRGKSKRSKKRKIKVTSLTDNDVSNSNIDENNTNEHTVTNIYDDNEESSFPRLTDSQDTSNNTAQSSKYISNTEYVNKVTVFDFKDESSCDTRLEETYLSLKRRKLLNKKKFKTKRKRKMLVSNQSDDLIVKPKVLRSSRTDKLTDTGELSPSVPSEEVNKTKSDISLSVTDNMSVCESDDKQFSGKWQTVTRVSVSEENTENSNNLLQSDSGNYINLLASDIENHINLSTSETVKTANCSSLWEKISRCLNIKRRNVTTQVKYKQFTLQGEVTVEDTDAMSSETDILSLSDVICILTKLHDSV